MSTIAPASGAHELPIDETLNVRLNGEPALTAPVLVSERTSERLSFSSTKYGPSVSSGLTTQPALAAEALFPVPGAVAVAPRVELAAGVLPPEDDEDPPPQATSSAPPAAPNSPKISRRLS